ncbi:MAG TPA: hypothetical protein VIM25_12160 [Candidatus Limnocylindrales bacterium]
MTVDELERQAAEALRRWLDERGGHALLAPDGRAMVWTNGKPVALDVLEVIAALRRHEQPEGDQ